MSEPTQAQLELAAVNKAILAILNNDGIVEYYIGDRRARYSDLAQPLIFMALITHKTDFRLKDKVSFLDNMTR